MMDLSSHFPSETHLLTWLGRGALRVWSQDSTSYGVLPAQFASLCVGFSPE